MGMTPAERAKAAGFKNLSEVSEITGVSLNTLANWAKHKPRLFEIVLLGSKIAPDDALRSDGYVWVTFPKIGSPRVIQPTDLEPWRNRVGGIVPD
jgi:hypothetical protein